MKIAPLFPLGLMLVLLNFGGWARADDAKPVDAKGGETAGATTAPATKASDPVPTEVAAKEPASGPKTEPVPPPIADRVRASDAAAVNIKAPNEKKHDEDASTKEAREELAQAQQMADAALAAQANSSTPAQDTGPAAGANSSAPACDDEFSPAPVTVTTHHAINQLTNPDLGPDYADPTHHTMGELF